MEACPCGRRDELFPPIMEGNKWEWIKNYLWLSVCKSRNFSACIALLPSFKDTENKIYDKIEKLSETANFQNICCARDYSRIQIILNGK